jgi:Flp pilus assembly protein TadD
MSASILYSNGVPTPALAQEAKAAADRALALAPERSIVHRALSTYHRSVTRQTKLALAEVEIARRLDPADAPVLANLANLELTAGRLAESVRDGQAAAALDPRSASVSRTLALTLLFSRRVAEARALSARASALAPGELTSIHGAVMAELAAGDLDAARRVLAAAPAAVDPGALAAYVGNVYDLYWVLDEAGQRRLLSLQADAFDNDRGTWAFIQAQTYRNRGDAERARAYADTSQGEFAAQLRDTPQDAQLHSLRGVALALAGRSAEGIAEALRGASLSPVSQSAFSGPYLQLLLARTYLFAGQPEKALDVLEPLMRMPFYITPAWLRIDPNFTPLKGNPRFERLIAAH